MRRIAKGERNGERGERDHGRSRDERPPPKVLAERAGGFDRQEDRRDVRADREREKADRDRKRAPKARARRHMAEARPEHHRRDYARGAERRPPEPALRSALLHLRRN